jgi:hypothetical protein
MGKDLHVRLRQRLETLGAYGCLKVFRRLPFGYVNKMKASPRHDGLVQTSGDKARLRAHIISHSLPEGQCFVFFAIRDVKRIYECIAGCYLVK